ncbi:hypothetical protein EYC84_005750 [Monilinia fructicola]|uniref:Uncharacterized protein n=1 Tax=Monilinia fructicola TaxID=38448 RepID=A0A5M9K029_MONFR|nr:hypothetical protein EYC84_005750 [Monilinia fructicola]
MLATNEDGKAAITAFVEMTSKDRYVYRSTIITIKCQDLMFIIQHPSLDCSSSHSNHHPLPLGNLSPRDSFP